MVLFVDWERWKDGRAWAYNGVLVIGQSPPWRESFLAFMCQMKQANLPPFGHSTNFCIWQSHIVKLVLYEFLFFWGKYYGLFGFIVCLCFQRSHWNSCLLCRVEKYLREHRSVFPNDYIPGRSIMNSFQPLKERCKND